MKARVHAFGPVAGLVLLALSGCDRSDKGEAGRRAASAEAVTTAPRANAPTAVVSAPPAPAEKVEVPEVRVRDAAPTTVHVTWSAPEGTGVNEDAPFRVRWNRSDGLAEAPSDVKSTGSAVKDGFRVQVQPMPGAPNATLGGEIDLVVCDVATHSVCVPVRRTLELGFIVVKDATPEATVAVPLPEAKAR